MQIDDLRAKADRLMSELVKRPKVLEVLPTTLKDFRD